MGLFSKKKNSVEELLHEQGFISEKTIELGQPPYTVEQKFFVDGKGKKFAYYLKSKDIGLRIFDFNSLLSFELQEDGHTLSEGTAVKALAGGLLFGAAGALVGAVGKKKSRSVCESMVLRIRVNDLQDPLLNYYLIAKKVKNNSDEYSKAKQQAEELIATLAYIENNK